MKICDIDHLHKRFLDIWEWCMRQGFDTRAFTYVENAFKSEPTAELVDRKTEPTCDTCRHKGVEGCEQPCLGCGCCGLYEAMTGNDKLKEKVVEFIKSCARCKHRPIGAMMCEESCHYEPKTETQTETQNSNLTFENRTMLDCYNCKRYKSDDACVECRYEPKADTPQTEAVVKPYKPTNREILDAIENSDCPWK